MILDVISKILFYAIVTTPYISFIIVRGDTHYSLFRKIFKAVAITMGLSLMLWIIAYAILLRNG